MRCVPPRASRPVLATRLLAAFLLVAALFAAGIAPAPQPAAAASSLEDVHRTALAQDPQAVWVELAGLAPAFTEEDLARGSAAWESYSDLDELGRCGAATACVGPELLPTEERGSIGMVRPSGWQLARYDFVEGSYLFNRCHLIAFKLCGQNANELNLITGTRFMNMQGMDPFEDLVLDYVRSTGNHVLYRVTPLFEGDNLVASAVQMEALSVEDGGSGVCFNVVVPNWQPGVVIDYATGENWADEGYELPTQAAALSAPEAAEVGTAANDVGDERPVSYVLNTNTGKFHYPGCSSVLAMKDSNKQLFYGARDEAVAAGYEPCKRCNP